MQKILRTRGQDHYLTFSITSDILCKATELTEAKVYVEAPWVGGMKVFLNDCYVGHMTKMTVMAIYCYI